MKLLKIIALHDHTIIDSLIADFNELANALNDETVHNLNTCLVLMKELLLLPQEELHAKINSPLNDSEAIKSQFMTEVRNYLGKDKSLEKALTEALVLVVFKKPEQPFLFQRLLRKIDALPPTDIDAVLLAIKLADKHIGWVALGAIGSLLGIATASTRLSYKRSAPEMGVNFTIVVGEILQLTSLATAKSSFNHHAAHVITGSIGLGLVAIAMTGEIASLTHEMHNLKSSGNTDNLNWAREMKTNEYSAKRWINAALAIGSLVGTIAISISSEEEEVHETALSYIASVLIGSSIFTGFWHNFNRYRPNGHTLPKLTPELAAQHKKIFSAICKLHNREALSAEDKAILTSLIHQLTGDHSLKINEEINGQDGKSCLYQYGSMLLGRTSSIGGSTYTFVPCQALRVFTGDGPYNDAEIQALQSKTPATVITTQPQSIHEERPEINPIQDLLALILRNEVGVTGSVNLETTAGRKQLSQMLYRATTLLPEWIYPQAITDPHLSENEQISQV